MSILLPILVILVVILIFNVIIFVHELGHFLAARWRGLEVERFQIWFGKPIWKKTYNGVQYGLGWLPFGGFVALPQMAPMESIEGKNQNAEPLPPVKPIDKIIVAFAGPLFSFLLALLTACLVYFVGKPDSRVNTTTIGYVVKDSPAMKGGLQIGDTITAVNSNPVDSFGGNMDTGVTENIITSEGDTINFTVQRPGTPEPLVIKTGFDIPDTSWHQRKGLRKVGIGFQEAVIVGSIVPNGPGDKAGLKADDVITHLNGTAATSRDLLIDAAGTGKLQQLTVKRGEETLELSITPLKPKGFDKTAFGIGFKFDESVLTETILHPGPWSQITESANVMKRTIQLVSSSESSIGVDQLAGPIGIGKGYYEMLTSSANGWKLALWFTVLFNINLAILNMMPFPVLDGGHIVLSFLEMISGRPIKARVLEVIQTAFVLVIFGLFIYITSKDVGSLIPGKKQAPMEFSAE